MTRKMYRAMLPALLVGLVWATTACTDDESHIAASGNRLAFSVSVTEGWNNGQGRAALPRDTVQLLEGGETFTDSLFLHTLVTGGIRRKPQCDSILIGRAAPIEGEDTIANLDFRLFAYAYTGTWDELEANGTLPAPNYIYNDEVLAPTYTTNHYWPADKNLRFFAYAPADFSTATADADGTPCFRFPEATQTGAPTLTYTVPAEVVKQCDLLVTSSAPDLTGPDNPQTGGVNLTFSHALTAVKLACGKDMGEGVISAIRLKGIYAKGTYSFTATNPEEKWEIDKSEAPVTFAQEGLNIDTTGKNSEGTAITTAEQTFMMLPQALEGAQIEIVYNGQPLTANISGKWNEGTTVTYRLSTSSVGGNYTFEVTPIVTTVSHQGTTSNTDFFKVTSYKDVEGTREAVDCTIEYLGADGTWSPTPPAMLSGWTGSTGTGVGETTYSGTVTAQAENEINHQSILQNASAKGSEGSPYNLSNSTGGTEVQRTANCYVINAPGVYSFPLVYGNAIDKKKSPNSPYHNLTAYVSYITVGDGGYLETLVNHRDVAVTDPYIANNEECEPDDAVLVWQDAENLVTDIALVKGSDAESHRITFKVDVANIRPGNAIIAVRNAEDVILWSWHIWVIDLDLEDDLKTVTSNQYGGGGTYQLLTHSLGGCPVGNSRGYPARSARVRITQSGSNEVKTVTITQSSHITASSGFHPYYQWGRKDPMLPSESGNNNDKHYYPGNYSFTKDHGGAVSIGEAIRTPYKFHSGSTEDWCTNHYNNLWGTGNGGRERTTTTSDKSIYDPCPVGYKVAVADVYAAFTPNGEPVYSNYSGGTWMNGWNLNTNGGFSVFFPASGWRDYNEGGSLHDVNTVGYYWSSIPQGENTAYYFFASQWQVAPISSVSRAYAMTIRPILE